MKYWLSILALLGTVAARAGFSVGPFYERASATNGMEFLAVRPFYSSVKDPANERWVKDFLWPLYTQKGFKDETYGRFLFFGYSSDFSTTNDRHRVWVLPFFFKGESAEGEKYVALFPLGGTLREFLGRDEAMFVLFPLYAKSRINEVQTTSVLWPIGSKTTGDGIERFRVWPFYGRSLHEGKFEKKFILWPIYNSVQFTDQGNPGGGFVLFPLYGRVATEKGETRWLLPPFFRRSVSADQRYLYAPWPFVQLADGTIHKRDFWPLYGKKVHGPRTRQYFCWPIGWDNKTVYPTHEQHRRRIVPFFTYEAEVVGDGEAASRYWKLWPLMSWERQGAVSRFRLLDLWPLRHTPGIERNWAPLWTLYSQSRSADAFEWSLLKGFVGYKKMGDQRRIRLLWFGADEETQP